MNNLYALNSYYQWLCRMAFPNDNIRGRYDKLLTALNSSLFGYILPMDENRLIDGVELRIKFCNISGLDARCLNGLMDSNICSVLEMMIALAIKCDENVMFDFEKGSRVHIWFFEMLRSLGLDEFDNVNFDRPMCEFIIKRFLNMDYERNGKGGLFTVNNNVDMRSIDIWYQLCFYLEENF